MGWVEVGTGVEKDVGDGGGIRNSRGSEGEKECVMLVESFVIIKRRDGR